MGWPLANLGGVNEVVRNLIHEFSSSGDIAPLVIEAIDGASEGKSPEGTPVIRMPLPPIYDERSPIKSLLRFCLRAPAFFRQLRSVCQRHDVQVLNPHFIGLEHLTLLLFRWLGYFQGQIVLSFHGSDIRHMIQSRGVKRFLSQLLLRRADLLIPCSEGLGQEILLLVPDCAHRIVAVSNGIDAPRFLARASADLKLPESFEKRRCLLSIGAFEYKKGHDSLIKAFAKVHQARTDTCLVIAGQTRGEIDATRKLIVELSLDHDVLLLQDLPHTEIAALLLLSKLFVLSSRWEVGVCGEGFAMALLEAAAAKKPVISTLSCGVAELIVDGESGTIVPPDNPQELAKAMLYMLDNPAEAARRARNLNSTVLRHFTWRAAHQQYLALMHACRSGSPLQAARVNALQPEWQLEQKRAG